MLPLVFLTVSNSDYLFWTSNFPRIIWASLPSPDNLWTALKNICLGTHLTESIWSQIIFSGDTKRLSGLFQVILGILLWISVTECFFRSVFPDDFSLAAMESPPSVNLYSKSLEKSSIKLCQIRILRSLQVLTVAAYRKQRKRYITGWRYVFKECRWRNKDVSKKGFVKICKHIDVLITIT